MLSESHGGEAAKTPTPDGARMFTDDFRIAGDQQLHEAGNSVSLGAARQQWECLAGLLADRVSEHMSASLAKAVSASMAACEARLARTIRRVLEAKRPSEPEDYNSAFSVGARETPALPPRRIGSCPAEARNRQLPGWAQKAMPAHGSLHSMRDLENCYSDFLVAERITTRPGLRFGNDGRTTDTQLEQHEREGPRATDVAMSCTGAGGSPPKSAARRAKNRGLATLAPSSSWCEAFSPSEERPVIVGEDAHPSTHAPFHNSSAGGAVWAKASELRRVPTFNIGSEGSAASQRGRELPAMLDQTDLSRKRPQLSSQPSTVMGQEACLEIERPSSEGSVEEVIRDLEHDEQAESEGDLETPRGDSNLWDRFGSFVGSFGYRSKSLTRAAAEVQDNEGPTSYVTRTILDSEGADFSKVLPVEAQGPDAEGSTILAVENSVKLRAWGVLPAESEDNRGQDTRRRLPHLTTWLCLRLFLCLVPLASLGAFGFCLLQVIFAVVHQEHQVDNAMKSTVIFTRVLDFIVSLGGLVSLLLLSRIAECGMEKHLDCLLLGLVQRRNLVKQLIDSSKFRIRVHFCLCTLSATARFLAERDLIEEQHALPVHGMGPTASACLRSLVFLFSAGLLVVTMYCLSHICSTMTVIVHAFCFRCANPGFGIADLMHDWNMIQARFRRVAGYCEYSILLLIVVTTSSFVISLADTLFAQDKSPRALWTLAVFSPLALLAGMVFAKAADVTEKCRRVASLANSMSLRHGLQEHLYLVSYISHSSAGFYVGGVAVSGTMFLKASHFGAMACFALISRLLG